MGIKQRTAIPGGACAFDLPSYHYWLNQDRRVTSRRSRSWMRLSNRSATGSSIVLRLLREGGKTSQQVALRGVFQLMLAGKVAQLVRLRLDHALACVPEISANKYALNVRFTGLGAADRSRVVEQDVPFELTFCSL